MQFEIKKIAAFSDGDVGGNPAGIVIADSLPDPKVMQEIAADVGFSETAFAAKEGDNWRVRYFSPENEVPFCGHATIALGAALAQQFGADTYPLRLNDGDISVAGWEEEDNFAARLSSLPTKNKPAETELFTKALALFGLAEENLDPSIPPVVAHAGADHLVLALQSRDQLACMQYDLEAGRQLMLEFGLVTIILVFQTGPKSFDVRNAFASGGVLEDPATGAAAAAFAGYVRDKNLLKLDWSTDQNLKLRQGDDMGLPSRLAVTIAPAKGSPILVSGKARVM